MTKSTIDHDVHLTVEKEKKKWRDILHRLLDITLFLAKQNLPFRGHREDAGSDRKGNFFGIGRTVVKLRPSIKRTFSSNTTK